MKEQNLPDAGVTAIALPDVGRPSPERPLFSLCLRKDMARVL